MTTPVGCVWEVLSEHSLIITYCGSDATATQWTAYMTMMRSFQGRTSARFLIYADTVPPANVLADITNVARGQHWLVALISPSTAVRFAASTFSFVSKGFRFFAPDRISEALSHLGCDAKQAQRAEKLLTSLRGVDSQPR